MEKILLNESQKLFIKTFKYILELVVKKGYVSW